MLNDGRILEKNRTLADYGIGYRTNNTRIQIKNVPPYVFEPEGIIKAMMTNGSWAYDPEMINHLGLAPWIQGHAGRYGQGTSKTMTAAVADYLQAKHPQMAELYRLIYRKTQKFLSS